jgi:phosphohistidine swiveling domain-containing protein
MRNLRTLIIQGAAILVATLTFTLTGGAAPAGLTYAIKGAKIVTVSGAVIDNGSIVMRDGVIQAVGASIAIPADAIVTDGAGLTVYPGLIDMASAAPLEAAAPAGQDPAAGRGGGGGRGGGASPFATLEEAGRAKRAAILRPDYQAAENLVEASDALNQMAQVGITSVLAVPSQGIFKGQSALVNTMYPPEDPQISTIADYRRGLAVVKAPVAQHVNIGGRGGGTGYPNSLLGTIAFTRQGFLDAQWQRDATAIYEKTGARGPRPLVEPSLDALKPALSKQMPVAFDANEGREIDRSLLMARDFGLDPIIVGGSGAASRIADLQKAKARVIYGVNFRGGGPGAARGGGGGGGRGGGGGDSLRAMQAAADAPKVPSMLAQAGVPFAFTSGGTLQPADFIRNAARTVKEGNLTADAALKALTLDAARIAGAADRVGSIEQGKIANIVVTDGDLFEAATRVRHVFIDGRPIEITATAGGAGRGGRGGGH